MSCNGCRVLRKGCSESCILRPCLQWIDTAQAQGNATLFVAKFFGRADLMSFISAVPLPQRPALFQSLLFEACGRTINPVSGAVGLLASGNWHVCQAAVQTVLSGGILSSIPPELLSRVLTTTTNTTISPSLTPTPRRSHGGGEDELSSSHAEKSHMLASGKNRSSEVMEFQPDDLSLSCGMKKRSRETMTSSSLESEVSDTSFGNGDAAVEGRRNPRLLNLFV